MKRIWREEELDRFYKDFDKEELTGYVVLVSGYFNPFHCGHLNLIQEAREYGDTLVVAVNGDKASMRKHNYSFMPAEDRMRILYALKGVDYVIGTNDSNMVKILENLKPNRFLNGGDVTNITMNKEEEEVCHRLGIEMIFDVGGEKIQSSSKLIEKSRRRRSELEEAAIHFNV